MVAFPAQDFQPNNASGWCNLFVHRVLLQRESVERVLTGVCADSTILGSHSHILVWTYTPTYPKSNNEMQTLVVLKALWCHAIEAPFGIRITEAICRQCGVLRKREIIHNAGQNFFMVRCRSCVRPPPHGPRGGAVPQSVPIACDAKLIVLRGSHLNAPRGANSPSGT